MVNGSIEYNERKYKVIHQVGNTNLGPYHTISMQAGRERISVTGETLADAVEALKQTIDAKKAKRDRG